jgi:carbonic anhydrase
LVPLLCIISEECPWTYDTPNQWSSLCNGVYKICELGHRQSPVAIDSKKLKPAPATFKSLTISYGQIHHTHVEFYDGIIHLLEAGARHTIKGGPLEEEYVLRQFHFHTPGEHSLDSLVSALEVHFVHFSPDNTSIAVLSVRFRERNNGHNAAWLDQVLNVRAIKRIMEGIDTTSPAAAGLAPSGGVDSDGSSRPHRTPNLYFLIFRQF